MGKKRKATGSSTRRGETQSVPDGDSRLRTDTYEDVADSEDEFHINNDKILLEEGPVRKKLRKLREEGKASADAPKYFKGW